MTYPQNNHLNYHAHIYFDPTTCDYAKQLYAKASQQLNLPVGRFNEKLVGPHTQWSFSITFSANEFEAVISWLESQRNHLSVLIHALTDDELRDHTEFAYWLGEPIKLDLSGL